MGSFLQSALAATLASGFFSLLMWLLNRKAQKEDKSNQIQETLNAIQKQLSTHITNYEESQANNLRFRILRFADEVRNKQAHHKEAWHDILKSIDAYEAYCARHPNYANNRAVLAIEFLKDKYKDILSGGTNDVL